MDPYEQAPKDAVSFGSQTFEEPGNASALETAAGRLELGRVRS